MQGSNHGTSLFARPTATLLIASRSDELEAQVRAIPLGSRIRIDRARTLRELNRLLAPAAGAVAPVVDFVVLDDELDPAAPLGPELIRELLQRRPDIKVVWVRARLDIEGEIEARRMGAYFILGRPIEPTLLERVVAKLVEHETTRVNRTKAC